MRLRCNQGAPWRGSTRQGADHVHGVPPDDRGRDQNSADFSRARLGATHPAFIRIVSFVDGRVDLALACINRDLREGRLHAALVAPDGTIKMRLAASDWQRRTVHAPHNPAEGVGVEPYEEGRFFIWRADLDREYPTNPVPPASAPDQQLHAVASPSRRRAPSRQPSHTQGAASP